MGLGVKRWLGMGPSPAVGLQITSEGVYLALVRVDGPTVVGLGHVGLPVGSVVDGQVRRPNEVGRVIDDALAGIHWSESPVLHVAVDPVPWSGVDQPGVIPAAVYEAAPGAGGLETGMVAAAEQVVASAAAAAEATRGTLRTVETAPISVARFLRLSRVTSGPHFARYSQGGHGWTLCDGHGRLDVEVTQHRGGLATLGDGPDLARLETTQWGDGLVVHRRVRASFPLPGMHAVAIGAAIGWFGLHPVANLLGPASSATGGAEPFGHWTMERVR